MTQITHGKSLTYHRVTDRKWQKPDSHSVQSFTDRDHIFEMLEIRLIEKAMARHQVTQSPRVEYTDTHTHIEKWGKQGANRMTGYVREAFDRYR